MKKMLALSLTLLCGAMLRAEESRPEVGRYTQAYSGDEGIQVFVTRVGAPEKAEVLIRICHVDHPLDGVVRKARVEGSERGRRYFVGKDTTPLILDGTGGTVYLSQQPNNPHTWIVKYDSSLSDQTSPEHLLTRWMENGQK